MIFTYLEDIRRRKTKIEASMPAKVSSLSDIGKLIRAGHQVTSLALQAQVQFKHTKGLDKFLVEAGEAREALDLKIKSELAKLPRSEAFEEYAHTLSEMLGEVSVLGPLAEFRGSRVYTFAEHKGKFGLSAGPSLAVPSCKHSFNDVLNLAARLVGKNCVFINSREVKFSATVKEQSLYSTTYEIRSRSPRVAAREVERRFASKYRCSLVDASMKGNTLELVHVPGIEDEHIRNI